MAEIINLRRARKQRGRDARRKAGDENAARHGRSAAERAREAAEATLARRRLDGHRRDETGETGGEAEEDAGGNPDRDVPDAPRE
ncbi:DUF4169 family protein [Albimonas pacifica]|uniref:DUF4169 domain-containing protein n=1 Tax=Albimonas pacifica TaxID=1114924 RepID=A0A1I3KAD1_9RHOB|nr:protein of unknown function [Albimonas pacifica]